MVDRIHESLGLIFLPKLEYVRMLIRQHMVRKSDLVP